MPLSSSLNLLADSSEALRDYVQMMGTFPFRPTLFVGLGGTGSQAVSKIKQLYLDLVAPQAHAGMAAQVHGIDPLYAFLAFDTNQQERPGNLIANKEWFHLGVGDLSDFYENHGKDEFYEPWVVKKFPTGAILAGCSGFRNLGRLVLMQNIDKVNDQLNNASSQIMTAAAGLQAVMTTPVIHVFCSLAGGTGSGMVLDLSFLLRAIFPTGRVIGHIAVVDGLPNVPQDIRSTIRVNSFCALKELNAFMSGLDAVPSGRLEYPMGVSGMARDPFDECYLTSSSRLDGSVSLPRQEHLSSFLARMAFMMSGYSFQPNGESRSPDYEGVMVNHMHRLVRSVGGARTCYMVPGFAQVHFPVGETADLLTLDATRRYLQFQRGGSARDGNEEARAFSLDQGLSFPSLRDRIAIDPEDKERRPVAATRYDEVLKELFESWEENRDAILGYAARLPTQGLSDYQAQLQPNVVAILGKVVPAIHEAATRYFHRDGYLTVGTLDFFRDLRQLLQLEREKLKAEGELHLDLAFSGIEKQWSAIRSEVENVLTNDGLMDALRDRLHRPKVRGIYTQFLNDADQIVLDKARNELTTALLASLVEELAGIETSLTNFQLTVDEAVRVIAAREMKISTVLFTQTNAQDPSVLNIRSFNAMDEEWRRTYIEHSGLSAPTILGTLIGSGWKPFSLLSLKPPAGITVGQSVANQVVEQLAPYFEEVRRWSPADVLEKTEKVCRVRPEQVLAKVFFTLQQAQMEIGAMRTRLQAPVDKLLFFGGITPAIRDRLAAAPEFAGVDFNLADNQETSRINFISVNLPVALAGCDMVVKRLQPDYDHWLEQKMHQDQRTRDNDVALHHCFPGSFQWPVPTQFAAQHDLAHEAFARALAISEILEVSEADRKRMSDSAKTPKDQRYSLFQVGASQFWLWPFFAPFDASSSLKQKPQNLGSNVEEAIDRVSKSVELQKQAHEWVQWFEANWSGVYTSPQVLEARNKAIESFYVRKGKSKDPRLTQLWDEIIAIVQEWSIGGVV